MNKEELQQKIQQKKEFLNEQKELEELEKEYLELEKQEKEAKQKDSKAQKVARGFLKFGEVSAKAFVKIGKGMANYYEQKEKNENKKSRKKR